MGMKSPKDGAPGTTDQSPRWEGPKENRPRGYLPAKDDPDIDRDAMGENNQDPELRRPSDAKRKKMRREFAQSRGDRESTGVASSKPTVITGSQNVTGDRTPLGTNRPKKDWM